MPGRPRRQHTSSSRAVRETRGAGPPPAPARFRRENPPPGTASRCRTASSTGRWLLPPTYRRLKRTFGELGVPARLVGSLAARASRRRSRSRPPCFPTRWPGRTSSAGRRPAPARRSPSACRAGPAGGRGEPGGGRRRPGADAGADPRARPAGRRALAPRAVRGRDIATVHGACRSPPDRPDPRRRVSSRPRPADRSIERGASTLGGVEITVLDEADQMADWLPAAVTGSSTPRPGGQPMLFSATLDRGVGRW